MPRKIIATHFPYAYSVAHEFISVSTRSPVGPTLAVCVILHCQPSG